MCKSKAEGGRRCAAHLAPAYLDAIQSYRQSGILTPEAISQVSLAATAYASTPFGYKKVELDREAFAQEERGRREIKDIGYETDPATFDFAAHSAKIDEIYETGIVAILNDSMNKGYELSKEYAEKEREIYRVTKERSNNASPELVKALGDQDLSIDTFFSAIRVARALGADVPAIEGTSVFELKYSQGQYDDWHEVSLGHYGSESDAKVALASFLFNDLEDCLVTPWGDLADYDDPAEWDAKRKEWFRTRLPEIIEWYSHDRQTPDGYDEGRDFEIKKYVVWGKPSKAWEESNSEGAS